MKPTFKQWFEQLEWYKKILSLFIAGITAFLVIKGWVESTARNAVLDDKVLAKLSAQIRPACIVNSRGSIEADLGAMEHINDIQVIIHRQVYGFELVINPKHHLTYPPMVRALNSDVVPSLVQRGKMYQWSVSMMPQSTRQTIITEQEMDTNKVYSFLVEILH